MDQQPQLPIGAVPVLPTVAVANPETIDMQMFFQEHQKAKNYNDQFTKDFSQLDTIVDGAPINQEQGKTYVGDTTIAGLVRQIPRQSLQRLPVFAAVVNGSKYNFHAIIASWILRRGVFNEDTFGKGILSTMQMGCEEALAHGYAPFMCAVGTQFGEFGTTMKLLHYSDTQPEPGVQDAGDSGFHYVEANLLKSRVIKIRDAAMNNPNTTWNVEALNRLLESEPVAKNYSIYQGLVTAGQHTAATEAPTYTFITRYEVGKKGRFVTACPQIEDVPLRIVKNKSKFGFPRVQYLVLDPAPLHPFGKSRVRLASPNQNLMNAYYTNVASMFILNSDPPVLQRGRFTKPIQLKRGARWQTFDQNATVELKELSNKSLDQFVPIAKQMASQIQNIMGAPAGNIAGNENAMGYSKTGPGVKAQREDRDLNANQITNILENFTRQYALVALDTYLAEQCPDGYNPQTPEEEAAYDEVVIVDDEAKNALNRLQPGMVGDDNKVTLNWHKFYGAIEKLSVEIELSFGKDELEEKKRGDLQDTLTVMSQNADPNDPEKQQKIREIEDRLLEQAVPESRRLTPTPPEPAPVEPTQQTQMGPQTTINQ